VVLPKEENADLVIISKLIEKYYPNTKLVEKTNDYLIENCGSDLDHPGYIKADFNGDGKYDYALLLSNKGINVLVVFMEKDDEYVPVFIEKEAAGDIIESIKKGERIDAGEELLGEQAGNHVVLKHPGIEAIFCGKSSIDFYWDEKKKTFIKVWTGD
jgi:hypothetical protein